MRRFGSSSAWVLGLWLAVPPSAAGVAGLDAVCPVNLQGVPLGQAVHELAVRLEVPYLLDMSVGPQALETPVRVFAAHLTGRQAIRWTARSVGLDAILVRDTMLIADPGRLPLSWRAAGVAGGAAGAAASQARWEAARGRRADISWLDAPLSLVARDVSDLFGVDLIFAPELLANQDLVQFEAPGASLDTVQTALADQLKATIAFVDGALWAAPAGEAATQPASRPAEGAGALSGIPHAEPVRAPPAVGGRDVLGRPVRIARSMGNWSQLGRQVGAAAGVECRIDAAGTGDPSVEAEGPLATVLEAARMLEGWTWTLTPAEAGEPPILLIRTSPSRSSGG